MLVRSIFPIVGLTACLAVFGASPQKEIRHVSVKPTSPASAPEMYTTCCAVCHGVDGKGSGPAAGALKVPPPKSDTSYSLIYAATSACSCACATRLSNCVRSTQSA